MFPPPALCVFLACLMLLQMSSHRIRCQSSLYYVYVHVLCMPILGAESPRECVKVALGVLSEDRKQQTRLFGANVTTITFGTRPRRQRERGPSDRLVRRKLV